MRGWRSRAPIWIFLGSLLLQAAWIVAVPPFRGIDEPDHAYRAASVAQGHWFDNHHPALHGRGDLIVVPRGIVTAAGPECSRYDYMGHDNCFPVENVGHGNVTVASAAANYNPVFYWVIGITAKPFGGTASLYAMRACAAALCSILLALAAWQLCLWSSTWWPIAGLLAAMTPMTVYSSILPAPNGIEILAGLVVWAGLLGIDKVAEATTQRALLLSSVPGVAILAGVRLLGPLWLGMIALSVIYIVGWRPLMVIWNRSKAAVGALLMSAALATSAGIWWSCAARTFELVDARNPHVHPEVVRNSLLEVPMWVLQTIGVFPTRTEAAPMLVYAVGIVLFAAVLTAGFWKACLRHRLALAATTVASLLVPLAMTIATYAHIGNEWQGRYELPFAIGIPLIGALMLDRRNPRHRLHGPLLTVAWAALTTAQSMSVIHVLLKERANSPLAGTDAWHIPPVWLVVVIVVAGMALWALAVREIPRWRERHPIDDETATLNARSLVLD